MNEHNLLGICELLKLGSGHQSHLAKAKYRIAAYGSLHHTCNTTP